MTVVHYPKIMMLLAEISADNGGCSADEWERMLRHLTDEEILTLATGEDTERSFLLAKIADKAKEHCASGMAKDLVDRSVERLDEWLNMAFDA